MSILKPMTGAELKDIWDNHWPGEPGDYYFDEGDELEDECGVWQLDMARTYSGEEIEAFYGRICWQGLGRAPTDGFHDWSFGRWVFSVQEQGNPNAALAVSVPKEKLGEFKSLLTKLGGSIL